METLSSVVVKVEREAIFQFSGSLVKPGSSTVPDINAKRKKRRAKTIS